MSTKNKTENFVKASIRYMAQINAVKKMTLIVSKYYFYIYLFFQPNIKLKNLPQL